MTLPNIIIPGAPKSATTSITEILNQHPEIFVPSIKEPRFFISDEMKKLPNEDALKKYLLKRSVLSFDKYKTLYQQESKFKIDPSVQYLFYYKSTVPKIKEYLGDPYIFLILRNPIPRAISNFEFNRKIERSATLIDAIKEELNGGRENLNSFFHYYEQGLYYEQVKLFKENFTNVKVLFYEDFAKDNLSFVNAMIDMLGLSKIENLKQVPNFLSSGRLSLAGEILLGKYSLFNIAYKLIFPVFLDAGSLFRMKMKLTAKFSLKPDDKVKLNKNEIEFLKDLYREDVKKLMGLLNIDKCPWGEF
jgi:hypothetical protein